MAVAQENVNRSKTRPAFVPTTNVVLFAELVERLCSRDPTLPAMGAFFGPSGFGKTFSATFGAHKRRAYYVEVGSSWTTAKFCRAVLSTLGQPDRGTIADLVERIIEVLAESGRPLIIDEFDHVVNRGYVEIVREIHDKSRAPIILIGEELLAHKLQRWERFHNRVLDWVPAQPCDQADTAALARMYAPGLEISPDILANVLKKSQKRARRIAVNIARIAEIAALEGWASVDRAQWGGRAFYTGESPTRRPF